MIKGFNRWCHIFNEWSHSGQKIESRDYLGSYMSDNVVLNLINWMIHWYYARLCRVSYIVILLSSEFIKINNTQSRILDSIYHITYIKHESFSLSMSINLLHGADLKRNHDIIRIWRNALWRQICHWDLTRSHFK